ncbi:BTB/POZ and leucine-rich repeat-containing protein [Candidatus Protochlamydia amoebophila]|nr:BTB/POZ and leucine-rich repeat-containing protein [Candidatus Protochlamydia amoebophila]
MHIHNPSFNRQTLIANADTHLYYRSNVHLKFSERINLLCKTIFQNFLNLFFNYINRDQLQSQWREIFWGRKEIATTLPESGASLPSWTQTSCFIFPPSTRIRTQEIIDYPRDKNKPLVNSLAAITNLNTLNNTSPKEIEASTIQTSNCLPFSQEEFKLRFQDETSLIIPSSQLSLLMEKSPYFKSFWSGNFQETLQDPLTLTKKEFTHLVNCLMDANFKAPVEDIPSFIQLADYYQLTEVVKNLEEQLIDGYKLQRLELFNSNEDSLVELKELLNFAQQYQLKILKSYLEFTVVSSLLNKAFLLSEFEKILKHFSNEIEELNLSEYAYFLADSHLLALKNCKNLKVLHLKAYNNLTVAGLVHLASLTALQHLNLNSSLRLLNLTDAGLARLTPLIALQHLDLSDCENLTDPELAHLTPLIALQHLSLNNCKKLTDAGLAHLTPLIALQHLDLSDCENLTDPGLAHLTPLIALQHLSLNNCKKLTDAGLAHLTPLVALQHLSLSWCLNLTDDGLAHLTSLVDLQHLSLSWCPNLTGDGLAHLTPLVALQHLNLSWCPNLTDDGLAHLAPLMALQHLNLSRCVNLTDAGLAHLAPLMALQHLNLSRCVNLTDAGLAHLAPLVALQHLNLKRCDKLTDAELAHLRPLVALQHLNLSGCVNLTDAGLAHLAPLVALQHLNLSECVNLTDVGLAHLTPLAAALQHLNLSGCVNLTDAGLAHFKFLVDKSHLGLR